MAEPWTEPPTDEAPAIDERMNPVAFLSDLRVVLSPKAEGLTEQQAPLAAGAPPSDLPHATPIRHE